MQKYTLIIITLLFSFSLFAQTKSEVIVDWNCKSVNYEGEVQRLPDRARVKAEIKIQEDGEFEIKFKDNIFKDGLKDKIGGFLGGLFGKKIEKTHAVDYTECLANFKEEFVKNLNQQHTSICAQNSNCPSQESLILDFNNTLEDQKTVRKINELPKVPRYFTGHDESFINFNVRDKLNDYCVNNEEISLEILLSRQFIEQVANEVINLNPVMTDACLNKIETVLKQHNSFDSCAGEGYPCNVIADANFKYSDENLNFVENKHKLISDKAKEEQAQRIAKENEVLKANGYITDPDTSIARKFREKLDEDIAFNAEKSDSYCWSTYTITDGNRRKSIFNYDSLIQENMSYIKDNLKPECLDDFIENYIAFKYRNDDPAADDLCRTHDCEYIRDNKLLFEQNLNGLIQYTFGDAAVTYSCNNKLDHGSSWDDVNDLLKNMKNVNMCSPLSIGETKVVEDFATTGVKMRYALKRTTDKELQANVVINFEQPDADASETQESMMARTKACLDTTSSYFTSPQGETIRVNVLTPEEAQALPRNERPRVNDVGIGDSKMRSNSGKYASNTGCGTITHEVLHLMGLCDEYEETQNGYYINTLTGETVDPDDEAAKSAEHVEFKLAYNDCRAISETPSIMSSHWKALDLNTAQKTTCTCKEGYESKCSLYTSGTPEAQRLLNFSTRNPFTVMNQYSKACRYEYLGNDYIQNMYHIKNYEYVPKREIIYANSIDIYMNSFEAAESGSNIGRMNKYKFKCRCDEGDSECMESLSVIRDMPLEKLNPSQATCEYPLFQVKEGTENSQMISRDELDQYSEGVNVVNGEVVAIEEPENKNPSLLHPAHFTRIKYGSCKEKAQTYSTCAKYAYKGLAKDCPDRPAICDEEEKWLLSDQ